MPSPTRTAAAGAGPAPPGPPPLMLRRASAPETRPALKLITDSIAQQSAALNRAVVSHPYVLAPYLAFLAFLARNHTASIADFLQCSLVLAGVSIAALSALGRFTHGYIEHAEKLGSREGLAKLPRVHEGEGEGGEGETLVALWRQEGEVIGTVVVRDVVEDGARRAEIWAWAVRLRYRGTGLGRDLLEMAVDRAQQRLGPDCEIVFAKDHAHSYRIPGVPGIFTRRFDRDEARARALLAAIVEERRKNA